MLLVYKLDRNFTRESQALSALKQLSPAFRARIGLDSDGTYSLTVPAGKRPLSVYRELKRFNEGNRWRLFGLDDEGRACIPIIEEQIPQAPRGRKPEIDFLGDA